MRQAHPIRKTAQCITRATSRHTKRPSTGITIPALKMPTTTQHRCPADVVVLVSAVCCVMAAGKTTNAASARAVQARARTATVSGSVTRTPAFCGGKLPTEGIDRPVAAVPYPGKTFHVIRGSTNTPSRETVLSFTSDASGHFSFRVPSGVYSILVDEQAQRPDASRYESRLVKMDASCFADWWAKPFYVLRVENSNIQGLKFEFEQRCFIEHDIPCMHYDGPLPAEKPADR
jgi:hypothetical protein